ncbi:hypothetical protein V1520DRAFT_66511 [Lipomyces starkeyi]
MGGWASTSIITKSPSHPNHLPWNPPKSSSITSTAFFLESLRSSLNRELLFYRNYLIIVSRVAIWGRRIRVIEKSRC